MYRLRINDIDYYFDNVQIWVDKHYLIRNSDGLYMGFDEADETDDMYPWLNHPGCALKFMTEDLIHAHTDQLVKELDWEPFTYTIETVEVPEQLCIGSYWWAVI